ncbi:MAG: hypothetical protein V4640_14060 [Verrucomicrobiota bacterium]
MKKLLAVVVLSTLGFIAGISQTTNPSGGDSETIAVVLGKEIQVEEKERLSGLVFGALLDQYAKDNQIEPTEAEIQVFLEKQEELSLSLLRESEVEHSRLVEALKSPALSVEQRKELQTQLAGADRTLGNQREARDGAKEVEKELRPLLHQRAAQQVRAWKIHQALFKQYGGRVIFQQAGVEPLDAYRDFLKDQQKKGAFRILDAAAEASFWKYFTDDSMHTFFSKEEGAKMMETPFWLMEKPKAK